MPSKHQCNVQIYGVHSLHFYKKRPQFHKFSSKNAIDLIGTSFLYKQHYKNASKILILKKSRKNYKKHLKHYCNYYQLLNGYRGYSAGSIIHIILVFTIGSILL